MSVDFKTILAGARLMRRNVPVCLRGDLVSRIEDLDRQIQVAEEAAAAVPSMEGSSAAVDLARELESLRTEMIEHTYPFVIQALPAAEYRQLKALYPPREDGDGDIIAEDRVMDANTDTFFEALLRKCCVDPLLDDVTWEELQPKLSDRQYAELVGMAVYVNKGLVDVPFSRAASRLLQSSDSE